MEVVFLLILVITMAVALASGYPVAFALPGSAIISIALAALCGYVFTGNADEYFLQGGPSQWLDAGVTNFRGVYWEVERDTLIAIPLFIFMGIMLQRSKIAEDSKADPKSESQGVLPEAHSASHRPHWQSRIHQ